MHQLPCLPQRQTVYLRYSSVFELAEHEVRNAGVSCIGDNQNAWFLSVAISLVTCITRKDSNSAMSAIPQIRPARPRGSQRSSRNVTPAENPTPTTTTTSVNESDEFRALRRKYAEKLTTIKEMFPTWSDEDILSLLSELNGSLEVAVTRISEGEF